MRAMISRSASTPLEARTLPSRALAGDEMRVRVRAIGVNPVDWKMREGGPLRFMQRLLGPRGPFVVGVDFAGEVLEVGPVAGPFATGTRVVGGTDFSRGQHGSYADEVIVRPDQCAVLPAAVTYESAACLPVAAVTAWIALHEHRQLAPGMKVLVLGAAGGVGLAALQLTRRLGGHAVGVCSTRNVAIVEQLGATAIDHTRGDALEQARALGPFDLVLHTIGTGVYPLAPCRRLLAPSGLVELVVVQPSDVPSLLFRRSVRTVLGRPTRARLEPLVRALAEGALDPRIEAVFPLADAEAAHVRSRGGKVVGKLLLVPEGASSDLPLGARGPHGP